MKFAIPIVLALSVASTAQADGLYDQYFAKAVGGEPCYARSYDAAHLKAHPRQKITSMEVDFDIKEGDTDRPNSAKYFEAGVGFTLKKSKDRYLDAAYCSTAAGHFDCYFDGDGGTFHLTPQGAALKLDVTGGGGGTDEIQVEGMKDFGSFGAPGSDDRSFILPPADRKICDAGKN
jgi:hypothetical protein